MIPTLLWTPAETALPVWGSRRLVGLAGLMAAGLLLSIFSYGVILAQPDAPDNLNRIKLTVNDVPGYSLVGETERDWTVFDADKGAPAECLRSNPVRSGREQVWRIERARNAGADTTTRTAADLINQAALRVDYGVFDSPGQAASAARQAALLLSSATFKMAEDEAIGDASWRTLGGSPSLIVARDSVVIYLAAQGKAALPESSLITLAQTLVKRIDAARTPATVERLACDVETYIGLGLVSDAKVAAELRAHARQLSDAKSDGTARRRALDGLKNFVQTNVGKGVDREAAVNLLNSIQSLADAQ